MIRLAAAAALALTAWPAAAHDLGMRCEEFIENSPEEQAEITADMVEERMLAEVPPQSMEEVTSMLLDRCNEFSDQLVITEVRMLPLATD